MAEDKIEEGLFKKILKIGNEFGLPGVDITKLALDSREPEFGVNIKEPKFHTPESEIIGDIKSAH